MPSGVTQQERQQDDRSKQVGEGGDILQAIPLFFEEMPDASQSVEQTADQGGGQRPVGPQGRANA